jgi:hypothetical protein
MGALNSFSSAAMAYTVSGDQRYPRTCRNAYDAEISVSGNLHSSDTRYRLEVKSVLSEPSSKYKA